MQALQRQNITFLGGDQCSQDGSSIVKRTIICFLRNSVCTNPI
jgi:hypothetical protein